MGQSRGSSYKKEQVLSPQQQSILNQFIKMSQQGLKQAGNIQDNPLYQQAIEANQQFLPGGQGFAPIQAEAQRNFQQQTIPSILNAFGSDAKSSSALNQALAASGANLNSSLAAQLSQLQLGAAGQSADLAQLPFQQAIQTGSLGLGTQPFALTPKEKPFWQQLLLQGVQGAGQIGAAYLGKP